MTQPAPACLAKLRLALREPAQRQRFSRIADPPPPKLTTAYAARHTTPSPLPRSELH